eukprot:jgi/Undpi1/5588/HiC_scaffold_2.g00864.m1
MGKSWALCALMALASLSSARSLCDDVQSYFDIPVPLDGDMEIDLDVLSIECEANGELPDELDEIIVQGGTLTITSTHSSAQFVNLRFTVEDGASLEFDVDTVLFGPNSGYEENAQGYMIDVKEGGSVTFLGDFEGTEVRNVKAMFYNAGSMDFKGTALFEQNANVFNANSGVLKFRDETTFQDNWYVAINNIDSGYIRFSEGANFARNNKFYVGSAACAIHNASLEGKVIFRGEATFSEHRCDGVGAINSYGTVKFYEKAYFIDNESLYGNGGAVRNRMGSMIFKAAVQFVGNAADSYGGGLAVEGGHVMFQKAVLFDGNVALETGGAFSVTSGSVYDSGELVASSDGLLTFKKPSVVRVRNNSIDSDDFTEVDVPVCTVGYVEDGSTVVGYPEDDICVEA